MKSEGELLLEEIAMDDLIDKIKVCVKDYYSVDGNSAGGSLHVVLDDGNMKDTDILYCMEYAASKRDWDGVIIAAKLMKIPFLRRTEIFSQ